MACSRRNPVTDREFACGIVQKRNSLQTPPRGLREACQRRGAARRGFGRYAADGEIPHAVNPTPLRVIYVLSSEAPASTVIRSLRANEAMMEFVQHSFILDIRSKATLSGHFERMATLANNTSVFRLDYPRDYALLPDVRSAIISHATALN